MTSQLRTLSLRRVIAGLIAIVCFVQAARLFLAPQLATEAAASVAQPQPAPLPRYVPIPIEQIREGDYVLTRDDHTGEFTSKPVVQSFRRTSDHLRRVEIRTQDGETATIQTTNEHPFWVEGKGWTDAAELQPDDTVTDETGQAVLVASTSYDPHDEGVAVFNFEVAQTHSYYVQAPNARGPPVWVHNTCWTDGYLSLDDFEANPWYHGSAPKTLPGEFIVRRAQHPTGQEVLVRYHGENFREGSIRGSFSMETKDLFIDVVGVSHSKEGIGTALYRRAIAEVGGDVKSVSGILMRDNADIFRAKGLEATPAFKIRRALGFTGVDEVEDLGERGIRLKMSRE